MLGFDDWPGFTGSFFIYPSKGFPCFFGSWLNGYVLGPVEPTGGLLYGLFCGCCETFVGGLLAILLPVCGLFTLLIMSYFC